MKCESGKRIRTGARIHFGLLDRRPPFGGAGMMVDTPATILGCAPADHFHVACAASVDEAARRDIADRVQAVGKRLAQQRAWADLPGCRIEVLQRPSRHAGLGTGTQLALAVATLLRQTIEGLPDESADAIEATIAAAGRQPRSAVGTHGYFQGGLIIDDSQVDRWAVPDRWRVVLTQCQTDRPSVHGEDESQRFTREHAIPADLRIQLRASLNDLVAGIEAQDFAQFAAAVGRYNRCSGELFADSQGGPYNGPAISKLIELLCGWGYHGVGQSSWGPTVFALCDSALDAQRLQQRLLSAGYPAQIAKPMNHPAQVTPHGS